jgi:hypothetical protein
VARKSKNRALLQSSSPTWMICGGGPCNNAIVKIDVLAEDSKSCSLPNLPNLAVGLRSKDCAQVDAPLAVGAISARDTTAEAGWHPTRSSLAKRDLAMCHVTSSVFQSGTDVCFLQVRKIFQNFLRRHPPASISRTWLTVIRMPRIVGSAPAEVRLNRDTIKVHRCILAWDQRNAICIAMI